MEELFTKEEVWGAVLSLGAQEDLSEEEVTSSKDELFKALDEVVAKRSGSEEEAKAEEAAPAEEAAAVQEKSEEGAASTE